MAPLWRLAPLAPNLKSISQEPLSGKTNSVQEPEAPERHPLFPTHPVKNEKLIKNIYKLIIIYI